jgi:glycosyltransferase involved in cell wall biosynthesis
VSRRLLEVLGYSRTGGAAESVVELTAAFARDGIEVTVAAPDEPGFGARVRRAGGRFVPVAMASRRDLSSFARLLMLMRRERFDAVHTHCRNADLHGGLAARATGTPLVVHLRGLLVDGEGALSSGLVDRIHRALLRRLPRRIVAISEAVRSRALAVLGVAPERVVTVRNGVEVGRFRAPARDAAALRAEFAIPDGAPLLLAVGALGRCKGQDLLIDALAATRSAPHALIVGDGDADGDELARLRAQAARRGVSARVRFAGRRDDVCDLLHAADLFVHPARWEGFGRVVAEAMAAARPVVATRVGGVPEIVADGVTGRLVDPELPDLLARAIDELLFDRSLARRLGDAAERFAVRELDAAVTARGVARLLFDAGAAGDAGVVAAAAEASR